MKLQSLTIKDFRSYADAEIDLAGIRLASIVGPNGAGKSSIMDAALFALTGARTRGSLDDWIRDGEEECRVSVVFTTGDERYRVTRTRSRRNSGKSTVELVREENGLWVAECTGARETEVRIEALLGVDEELLLMTSLIPQAEANRFLELTPGKRLEVFGEILRLDEQYGPLEKHWKAKAEAAKADLEDVRRDIVRLEAEVAGLESREADYSGAKQCLGSMQAQMVRAEQALADTRERARVAQDAVRETEQAEQHLRDLKRRRSEITARRDALAGESTRLTQAVNAKVGLEEMLANQPALEEGLARVAEAERTDAETRQKRAVLEAKLHSTEDVVRGVNAQGKPKATELDRLARLVDDLDGRVVAIVNAKAPVCDRCGQPIADQALEQTLEQLRIELAATVEQRNTLNREVEDLRAQAAREIETRKAIEADISALPDLTYDLAEERRLKGYLEQLQVVPAKLAEIAVHEQRLDVVARDLAQATGELENPALVEEIAKAEAAADRAVNALLERDAAEGAVKNAEAALELQRRELSDLEKAVARHEEAIALLGPSRDELKAAQKRSRDLEEEQADAELLRKAFSKWGVPALIIGNVLLALECEVNGLLALYDSGMTVRFESTKETRDGSRDSLEIIVDRAGASRSYETYSGGEKYRIASCVRLGLALLLAHRSGARIETLILDEPEGLDAEGREHLAAILGHLSDQFSLTLLCTHYADLQDAFPSQVLVTRGDDGLSKVEVVA